MKKGFTLIELLIVMVIISALIAVALPKYNRAMERGRALEGINKVKYAAEYAATKCLVSGAKPAVVADTTKGQDTFGTPSVSVSGCVATVTVMRNISSGWYYSLTAVTDEDGQVNRITCTSTSPAKHCSDLSLTDLGVVVPVGQ